jgi:hypothetical protein
MIYQIYFFRGVLMIYVVRSIIKKTARKKGESVFSILNIDSKVTAKDGMKKCVIGQKLCTDGCYHVKVRNST